MVRGFEGYRSIAPPGWEPPELGPEVERVRAALAGGAWALMAERDGALAGHTTIQAAATSMAPADEPALAHLRALFVEPEWWGSGLARELHTAALAEATRQGFSSIRLFTPVAQARARRFYEREGWRPAGTAEQYAAGLPVMEYRRELP